MSQALVDTSPRRRLRFRRQIVWTYMLSLIIATVVNSVRHWNSEQLERVAQWSLVFLSPALLVWFVQSVRRRLAMVDGGELSAAFPAQQTAPVPGWLLAAMFLLAAGLPFTVFAFRDSGAFVVMVIAFLGVLLFCVAWLWFDGMPTELRKRGLVVDGIHLVRFNRVERWEAHKRSNIIEVHDDRRTTRVYICPSERPRILKLIQAQVLQARDDAHGRDELKVD